MKKNGQGRGASGVYMINPFEMLVHLNAVLSFFYIDICNFIINGAQMIRQLCNDPSEMMLTH